MQVNEEVALKLVYPNWVRVEDSLLVNIRTGHTFCLTSRCQSLLDKAFSVNLLANPSTEYEF
jgi:hypothetical protein